MEEGTFLEPETTFVRKDWGYEYWFVNCDKYCGKLIVCRDNVWSSGGRYHYHANKDETFFVLNGELELDVEGEGSIFLKHLCSFRIRPFRKHRFRNVGEKNCRFIEVSTHHEDSDSYRVD